jgi:hypothetical protein
MPVEIFPLCMCLYNLALTLAKFLLIRELIRLSRYPLVAKQLRLRSGVLAVAAVVQMFRPEQTEAEELLLIPL